MIKVLQRLFKMIHNQLLFVFSLVTEPQNKTFIRVQLQIRKKLRKIHFNSILRGVKVLIHFRIKELALKSPLLSKII